MEFNLENLFKPKTPKPNSEREMLISNQNKFIELNALFSYELVKKMRGKSFTLTMIQSYIPAKNFFFMP